MLQCSVALPVLHCLLTKNDAPSVWAHRVMKLKWADSHSDLQIGLCIVPQSWFRCIAMF
jgi:hypothetical protein